MRGARPRGTPSLLLLSFALCLGCADDAAPRLSYDRCAAGDVCGLGTQCLSVALSTTGAAATLCSLRCQADLDCPGWSARCVSEASTDGDARGRCLRRCEVATDCRTGTRCASLMTPGGVSSVCVPDLGDRPCASAGDCAPFAMRCAAADGGAPRCVE